MSDIRYFTQEITPADCIGDSSAKYNYNFLSLDTEICNLSSIFYAGSESFFSVFSEFASNTSNFIEMADIFYNPIKFKRLSTVTKYLSSYWNKHEFTIHYPLNISTIQNFPISCPTVNQTDDKLISLARSYILNLYKPTDYTEGTKLNVVFFLYNVPSNPSDPNDLITKKTSPEFSYTVRHMYVEMIKQDVHLANGKVLKFINKDKQWILVSVESGDSDNTKLPILKNEPPPRISAVPTGTNGRQTINVNVNRDFLNFDLYYYVVQSGIYYAGYSDIILTIESNRTLGCNVNGGAALVISGFVTGDTIKIINNGNILGYGGQGGKGQSLGQPIEDANNGKNGGTAVLVGFPVKTFTNNGIIAGGGGGGAGGLAAYSDTSYMNQYVTNQLPQPYNYAVYRGGGGGGGGAGYVVGSFGIKGFENRNLGMVSGRYYTWVSTAGTDGLDGSRLSGGAGGSGHISGGNGGELAQDGTSTGVIDFLGRQLPPLGGKAGAAIIGRNLIEILNTQVSGTQYSYGDIRGSM